VLDPPAHHEFIASGRVDSNNQMVVSYFGRFPKVSHQYYAVAKIEFYNAADCKAAIDVAQGRESPLVLRCVDKQKLHDVLLNEILKGSKREPGIEVSVVKNAFVSELCGGTSIFIDLYLTTQIHDIRRILKSDMPKAESLLYRISHFGVNQNAV